MSEPPRIGPPLKFGLQFRPLLLNSADVSALVMEEQGCGLDEALDKQDFMLRGGSPLEVIPQVLPCLMGVQNFASSNSVAPASSSICSSWERGLAMRGINPLNSLANLNSSQFGGSGPIEEWALLLQVVGDFFCTFCSKACDFPPNPQRHPNLGDNCEGDE